MTSGRSWQEAGRALLARMIGELAYEDVLIPAQDGGGWRIALAGTRYTFDARRGTFGSWRVDPASIARDGEPADDPVRFALDARDLLKLDGASMVELVRDLTATQTADVRLRLKARSVEELAALSHEDLEGHQTGHPCIVLNKGRLGFSAADAARYAPESAGEFRLVWIAVAPSLATHAGLDVVADEFGPVEVPDGYVCLPVHPFQWDEVIQPLFAPQLASGEVVVLGESPDRYRPLQSVRTLTNVDRPARRNVKLSLMIRNTLVWRGLSAAEAGCAPYTTAWLEGLRARDEFLRDECRVVLLGEVASVTVQHPVLKSLADAPYRYHELLGAIWREPVAGYLEPRERARTMASLLLTDRDGRAFVAELVRRSGLDARAWLSRYLHALLPPILHYLYRYGACFTPHGENVVVIFDERDVPVRIALKDFGADLELLTDSRPEYAEIPDWVRAQLHRWSHTELAHSVLSAICAGVFRFLAPLVEEQLGVPEPEFWSLVRAEIVAYQSRVGVTDDPFALLAPEFGRVSLNREQLLGGHFHDRSERDAEFDVINGVVANPLHL